MKMDILDQNAKLFRKSLARVDFFEKNRKIIENTMKKNTKWNSIFVNISNLELEKISHL